MGRFFIEGLYKLKLGWVNDLHPVFYEFLIFQKFGRRKRSIWNRTESKQPQKIDASINYCIKFCCCEELGKFFEEIINTMVSKIFLSISLNRKLISVEKSLLKRLYDTHVLEGKCLGTEFTLYK